MDDFKEGDAVICTDNEGAEDLLRKGTVYTVSDVDEDGGIALEGVMHRDGMVIYFLPWRFDPWG